MSVKQVKKELATKDGRRWIFYTRAEDNMGIKKKYNSKKYMTRKEAEDAEKEFKLKMAKKELNLSDMTFKDLWEEFYDYKLDKVKKNTLYGYRKYIQRLEYFMKIKIKDLTIQDYLFWRSTIVKLPLAVKTKNGYYKLLKSILNYGVKWHDFNFTSIYNKMEKFTDPNGLVKEMKFYTPEEFKKFISHEDELEYITLFKTLYFCGLRLGEISALTWDDIDLDKHTININKAVSFIEGEYNTTRPKTKNSIRTLPMPNSLYEDYVKYYEESKKYYGFKSSWYVFGQTKPIRGETLRKRKRRIADEAGVKQIRIHDFRHSCASLLINNGANVMIVAKYLGHAKIDVTLNTYSHLFNNKMEDIVNLVDKVYTEEQTETDMN